jgi:[ribosomal protein S18]-alanine N-acetyltransferase
LIGTLFSVTQLVDAHAMTLTLQYMQSKNISMVSEIDNLSFDPPWPKDSYSFEINQSTISHMVVLVETPSADDDTLEENAGCRQIFDGLFSRADTPPQPRTVIGYGGLWKIADEAHISTIAIHPDYRGHSYGEILLAGMVGKAIMLKADYIVLEVRVSNHVAQGLYRKYGFTEFDIKNNYYRNNNENAYDMRVTFDPEKIATFEELYATIQEKRFFVDNYTKCPHPRLGHMV